MSDVMDKVRELIRSVDEERKEDSSAPIILVSDGRAEAVKAYLEYATKTNRSVSAYQIEDIIRAFDK